MELQGNGLTLKNWQLTDAPSLQKHADNVKVAGCLLETFPSPYTLANAEFFINLKINDDTATNLSIVVDDEVCGVIGIDNYGDENPLLGYWISEQHWGKGLMTEAVKVFTEYAITQLDISKLYAHVASKNPASMRVLEKAGYVKTNVLIGDLTLRGEVFDRHVFCFAV